jgi:hypothetical protein
MMCIVQYQGHLHSLLEHQLNIIAIRNYYIGRPEPQQYLNYLSTVPVTYGCLWIPVWYCRFLLLRLLYRRALYHMRGY